MNLDGLQLYLIRYALTVSCSGIYFTEKVWVDEPLSYSEAAEWCRSRGVYLVEHQGQDNG